MPMRPARHDHSRSTRVFLTLSFLLHVHQLCSFAFPPLQDVARSYPRQRRGRWCRRATIRAPVDGARSGTHSQSPSFLLSDVDTPALIVDVDAARVLIADARRDREGGEPASFAIDDAKPTYLYASPLSDFPILEVSQHRALVPVSLANEGRDDLNERVTSRQKFRVLVQGWEDAGNQRQLLFLHTRVLYSHRDRRPDALSEECMPTFLCHLDLPSANDLGQSSSASGGTGADSEKSSDPSMDEPVGQLVLGLNNHHVGSYYWARSAGTGAAMEAPGIELVHGNVLRWKSLELEKCNSNDGKRSEWVSFLRPGDQVQLVPMRYALMAHVAHYANENRVYGVSMRGRPLGSEPVVVCRYLLRSIEED